MNESLDAPLLCLLWKYSAGRCLAFSRAVIKSIGSEYESASMSVGSDWVREWFGDTLSGYWPFTSYSCCDPWSCCCCCNCCCLRKRARSLDRFAFAFSYERTKKKEYLVWSVNCQFDLSRSYPLLQHSGQFFVLRFHCHQTILFLLW